MELTNDFRVGIDPDQAWEVLTDVERIAPLLPGAQLKEVEGDEYRGIVKVKVGPIQAQYRGVASFLERDRDAGRVVLKASGRDTRGQGNATATITAVLRADGSGTAVSVVTDLTITGKVAQFGRGVLADVSGKLITQFVDALEADLSAQSASRPVVPGGEAAGSDAGKAAGSDAVDVAGPEAGDVTGPEALDVAGPEASEVAAAEALVGEAPSAHTDGEVTEDLQGVLSGGPAGAGTTAPRAGDTTTESPAPSAPTPSTDAQSALRRIDSAEAEPVDLLDAAGGSVAKRLAPLLGVVTAVVILLVVRTRRVERSARR